jgi:hypothetical protein
MAKKKESKRAKGDLAKDQELSIAVMNMVSIEEHLAFTIAKTKKKEYIEIYNQIRSLRSKYMKEIVKNKEGEMWCVSKHLLSTTMRLLETGIKYSVEDENKALDIFNDAADLYQVFWLLQKLGGKNGNNE